MTFWKITRGVQALSRCDDQGQFDRPRLLDAVPARGFYRTDSGYQVPEFLRSE
jgi:hypothetical protein